MVQVQRNFDKTRGESADGGQLNKKAQAKSRGVSCLSSQSGTDKSSSAIYRYDTQASRVQVIPLYAVSVVRRGVSGNCGRVQTPTVSWILPAIDPHHHLSLPPCSPVPPLAFYPPRPVLFPRALHGRRKLLCLARVEASASRSLCCSRLILSYPL